MKIGYIISKIRSKLVKKSKSYEIMNNYFRKGGAKIGKNVAICSNLDLCDKELLFIGDNVIISSDVLFVTHDISMALYSKRSGALFGKIVIGNGCFIGERSTILYGVTLPERTLVAAGSVVTKSFSEKGLIIGGNPAKPIGKIEDFVEKHFENRMSLKNLTAALANNDPRLIKR